MPNMEYGSDCISPLLTRLPVHSYPLFSLPKITVLSRTSLLFRDPFIARGSQQPLSSSSGSLFSKKSHAARCILWSCVNYNWGSYWDSTRSYPAYFLLCGAIPSSRTLVEYGREYAYSQVRSTMLLTVIITICSQEDLTWRVLIFSVNFFTILISKHCIDN